MDVQCGLVLLCLLQLVTHGFALRCYTCTPHAERNEDCGEVKPNQLRDCPSNQDLCRVTAVALYEAGTVKSLAINRGCSATADYPGNPAATLPANAWKCTTTAENLRASKLCLCNYGDCNVHNKTYLADMRTNQAPPVQTAAAAEAVPAATVIGAIFSCILLIL